MTTQQKTHWKPAKFKGKKVWVAVDEKERIPTKLPMRYSMSPNAKVYMANRTNITLGNEPSIALETSKKTRSSGFGKAKNRTQKQTKLAKQSAKTLLTTLSKETIICYTDGACRGNPGPAGSGAYIIFPDKRRFELAKSLGKATNNIGELGAIKLVLEFLHSEKILKETPIAVFTDSDYSIGVLVRNWKAKKNTALIMKIKMLLSSFPKLKIHWVAGHAGIEGNERADSLANSGVKGKSFCREI